MNNFQIIHQVNPSFKGFQSLILIKLLHIIEDQVCKVRKEYEITLFVKRIDTVAAEFPTIYIPYNTLTHDLEFDDHETIVLGSGIYCIKSSVEFD